MWKVLAMLCTWFATAPFSWRTKQHRGMLQLQDHLSHDMTASSGAPCHEAHCEMMSTWLFCCKADPWSCQSGAGY